MSRSTFTLACDDWTIHTMKLYLRGQQPLGRIRDMKASVLQPGLHRMQMRDPNSGRRFTWGYTVTMHFSSPETARLLTLGEIAALMEASLREFPWLRDPRLGVSRIDLASDHSVSAPPAHVCDLMAEVNLPHSQRIATYRDRGDPWRTVYHVSGRRSLDPIPFGEHHRKGKQPVVVAHYPRLEALLERLGPEVVSESAVEYTRERVRQEVRFRREAIRRYIGPGSAGLGAVLGSLPAFVRAARRRLRPVAERENILSFPRFDSEGGTALQAVADQLLRDHVRG